MSAAAEGEDEVILGWSLLETALLAEDEPTAAAPQPLAAVDGRAGGGGLSSRLAKAAAAKAAAAKGEAGEGVLLLPYDAMADFLTTHPLVHGMGVDPKLVHGAVLELHRASRAAARSPAASAPRSASDCPRYDCPHCEGGRSVIDPREGCRVCDGCGAVLTRSINVVPEYRGPTDADRAEMNRCRREAARRPKPALVPRWMVLKHAAPLDVVFPDRTFSSYRADLEHWNVFTEHPPDALRELDNLLNAWARLIPHGHCGWSRAVRVAAALLYPDVRVQIPDEDDVRHRVGRRTSLPVVSDTVPLPTYECADCGVLRHSHKEARLHCSVLRRPPRKRRRE